MFHQFPGQARKSILRGNHGEGDAADSVDGPTRLWPCSACYP